MPPFVYPVAGASYLVPAIVALFVMVVVEGFLRSRRGRRVVIVLALVILGVIVVSSPAFPVWFMAIWAMALVAWMWGGRPRWAGRTAVLACTAIGVGIEISRERLVPLPAGHFSTLCVIGDSVSAGLGRAGETPWPTVLRQARGIRVVDGSRAGATVPQAVQRASMLPAGPAVVVLEIGGNDLIGRSPIQAFETQLETLVASVSEPGRSVVMFELPRLPFDDGYGLAQRRITERYGVRLIPRRSFADVLAEPGATIDGVHLSNAGQQAMANLVWRIVGPAMGAR